MSPVFLSLALWIWTLKQVNLKLSRFYDVKWKFFYFSAKSASKRCWSLLRAKPNVLRPLFVRQIGNIRCAQAFKWVSWNHTEYINSFVSEPWCIGPRNSSALNACCAALPSLLSHSLPSRLYTQQHHLLDTTSVIGSKGLSTETLIQIGFQLAPPPHPTPPRPCSLVRDTFAGVSGSLI